eukprot:15471763-Alexandrium_andersonii.AAC.1
MPAAYALVFGARATSDSGRIPILARDIVRKRRTNYTAQVHLQATRSPHNERSTCGRRLARKLGA